MTGLLFKRDEANKADLRRLIWETAEMESHLNFK